MTNPKKYPALIISDFTAKNASRASDSVRGLSGMVTIEHPWGQTCTAFLESGAPVDRASFVREVLRVLAQESDGAEYVAKWRAHIGKLTGSSAADPSIWWVVKLIMRSQTSVHQDIKVEAISGERACSLASQLISSDWVVKSAKASS